MQIEDKKVVSLNFTLKDKEGNLIDQCTDSSFVYLHGAENILPALEREMLGKCVGDKLSVSLEPAEAYGERDDSKTQAVPREMFPADSEIEVGMQFQAEGPNGEVLLVSVIDVSEEHVTVDGNHPMAGLALNFDLEVMEVRDASGEELEHGHVHGPHGHQH